MKGLELATFISYRKRSSPPKEIRPDSGVKCRAVHAERTPNVALHELFEAKAGDARDGDAGPIDAVAV